MSAGWVSKGVLLVITMTLSLLAVEWIARLYFSPIDFLMPELERDAVINHRIKSGSAGHDEWGFRNDSVPSKVDILAIGDSMTYGVAATHRESWPTHLARMTGRSVYNMGLGGYGPMHYLSLLETDGTKLDPAVVVIGIYLGNDIMDAYNLVYSNDTWASYRSQKDARQVDPDSLITAEPMNEKLFGGLRDWLAHTSIVYRVATQSSVGNLVRDAEVRQVHENVIQLDVPGGRTFLTPDSRFVALDLKNPSIQEGVRLSLTAIDRIVHQSETMSARLVVALVPTKELVLEDFVLKEVHPKADSSFAQLVANERSVRDQLVSHMEARGVEYIDLLEPLRAASRLEAIYPPNDGHPNGEGYRIIAEALAERLGIAAR